MNMDYLNVNISNNSSDFGQVDNNINISDIQRIRSQKIKKKVEIYQKIIRKCFNKIRACVDKDETYCFFAIPEYNAGYPLYDIKQCAYFIMNKLQINGLCSKYIPPNIVFIYWHYKNPYKQIKMIQMNSERKPRYKMIEHHNINDYKFL